MPPLPIPEKPFPNLLKKTHISCFVREKVTLSKYYIELSQFRNELFTGKEESKKADEHSIYLSSVQADLRG